MGVKGDLPQERAVPVKRMKGAFLPALLRQQTDDFPLQLVGILKFVHQDRSEAFLIAPSHRWVEFQEITGLRQEIVEVETTCHYLAPAMFGLNLVHQRHQMTGQLAAFRAGETGL